MTETDRTDAPSEIDPALRLDARDGLPDGLRVLVKALPPEVWTSHAGFGGLTRFWLERHAAFRRILDRIAEEAEAAASGGTAVEAYAPSLYRHASVLLGELHGHHTIEDAQYFPQLRRLQPAVAHGFDLLEADHRDLDARLHDFAGQVNQVLAAAGEGTLTPDGVAPFAETLDGFRIPLDRHLVDEEEIVIPALLTLSSG
ncbi:MAG: hemerythrin domain-containing protein [Thalassobaculaceae bacterium]